MLNKRDNSLYKEIGKAIFRIRKKKMSQQALADEVGMSRASIVNVEQGRHRIQLHVLYEIAAILEVDPRDLLPAANHQQHVTPLPLDVSAKLNPKEQIAVGRLVQKIEEKHNE